MMQLHQDSKIYVHAPAGYVTGGVELLHQLVSFLRQSGREAFVVYYGAENPAVPVDYQCYDIAVADQVEDAGKHIEVYTEVMARQLYANHRKTQKFIWWLSVDNYYELVSADLPLTEFYEHFSFDSFCQMLIFRLKRLLHGCNDFTTRISLFRRTYREMPCGYQSEYIHQFLLGKGFEHLVALKDYIHLDHIRPIETCKREDIVLYNPAKGFAFTQQLIALAPDLHWVALQGMSRQELITVIRKAKLYIDFGNHPGKDRMPRECAINGCCVITGMQGAAAYEEDVPIAAQYKFDERSASLSDIVARIRWTLANYDIAINDFASYRTRIMSEKSEFEQQVTAIFLNNQKS